MRLKAVGHHGSWFADVNGERLPCVHKYWIVGRRHVDPGYVRGERQWDELVEAVIKEKKVIVTKDEPRSAPDQKSGFVFDRKGYIAVFAVDEVSADESGLAFTLTERIADLQG